MARDVWSEMERSPLIPYFNDCHALVVGISGYQHLRKLYKVEDAPQIVAALTNPGLCGYSPANVQLLEEAGATREAILKGLADLARKAGPKSTVFLYFSGHGGRIEEGPLQGQYLLPVDAVYPTDDDLARTSISGTEFSDALKAIKASRLTVVLDCCHAGGLGEPKDAVVKTRVQNGLSEGYLEALKAGSDRVIIAATRSSDPAYVRQGARFGVFTGHFLDGLRGAARGDGGFIRILDLYTYVQQKVVLDQPNQHPILKVELAENFPIALYRGGQAPAPAPVERPADGFKYDVFVSYSAKGPDKTWVRKVFVPRLKKEGLTVFIDYLDSTLGAPIIHEMERAVVQSRYTVAVLSPSSIQDNFAEFEGILAQQLGLEQSQRRFIGLMRENCKPRLGVRARYYLDMTDDDEFDAGVARLVAQARQSPDVERIET
jgi:Caspase domain/TIR domain